MAKYTAIVLSAGKGSRMGSLSISSICFLWEAGDLLYP